MTARYIYISLYTTWQFSKTNSHISLLPPLSTHITLPSTVQVLPLLNISAFLWSGRQVDMRSSWMLIPVDLSQCLEESAQLGLLTNSVGPVQAANRHVWCPASPWSCRSVAGLCSCFLSRVCRWPSGYCASGTAPSRQCGSSSSGP